MPLDRTLMSPLLLSLFLAQLGCSSDTGGNPGGAGPSTTDAAGDIATDPGTVPDATSDLPEVGGTDTPEVPAEMTTSERAVKAVGGSEALSGLAGFMLKSSGSMYIVGERCVCHTL